MHAMMQSKDSNNFTPFVAVAAVAGIAAGLWWLRQNRKSVQQSIENVIDFCDAAATNLERKMEAAAQTAAG